MVTAHPFFEWLASTSLSQAFNGANYLYFGLVMAVHLVGIALLGGSALVLDLKVLGLRLPALPDARVLVALRPWFWWGLALAAATGSWLLVADPLKYSVNPVFQAKAVLLLVAVAVQVVLHRKARQPDTGSGGKSLAVASLALWLAAAAAGRLVGLV